MSKLSYAIRQRRSIRKYLPKEVPVSLVVEVLEAARWAPSAHNSQCWRFIVLQDSTIKLSLAEEMSNAWAADLKRDGQTVDVVKQMERRDQFGKAPVLILACLTMEGLRRFPDATRQNFERDLAVQSMGAAIENLLLTAHMVGLGACWFCAPAFAKEIVRKTLVIPDEVEPSAMIVLGYPAETVTAPSKKELKDFCYIDIWGKKWV
jgi:coenzyme F420-0:L-glutamate ligase / coenzyme F420-1:gamma-L-glutamate ligase